MIKILILCTGNSCRSQMAAAFLRQLTKHVEVHSAGTRPAKTVNAGAVKYMQEIGIDISKEQPKQVNQFLNEKWDYVITVCGGANASCPLFTGNVKRRLHLGFDDPSHAIGTEEYIQQEYRRVRDEIKKQFTTFINTEKLY